MRLFGVGTSSTSRQSGPPSVPVAAQGGALRPSMRNKDIATLQYRGLYFSSGSMRARVTQFLNAPSQDGASDQMAMRFKPAEGLSLMERTTQAPGAVVLLEKEYAS